jgi:RNA polymerase sigma factor (sigma-70 family)
MADTGGVEGLRNDAFERLYAEHAQALFAFLRYRTDDPVLAEDLLADTYERVLRARRRFDPRKASQKTWLYAIALNCLTDHARRRATESRTLELIAASPSPGSIGESWGIDETDLIDEVADPEVEEGDLLNRSLALLRGSEREAIALRFGADLTVPEIAKLTGEKLSTVEGRVYRALRKLREAMD